jgi:hypothetical protein
MNEKTLKIEDIQRRQDGIDDGWDDEGLVPIDKNFESAVLNWTTSNQEPATPKHHSSTPLALDTPSALSKTSTPPPITDTPPAKSLQHQFNSSPDVFGGRPRKQSPIRLNRHKTSRSSVQLTYAQISQVDYDHPHTSPVQFRRKPQKSHKTSIPPPVVSALSTQGSVLPEMKAAPEDDEQAQALEDAQRLANNFDTWDDELYTLRIEEANLICDMLKQLCATLDLGAVIMVDQGQNLKYLLEHMDWNNIVTREDIVVSASMLVQSLHL